MTRIIEIVDKSNGISERKPAHKITKHLCTAYTNLKYDHTLTIYSILGQCPAIPHRFDELEDAIGVAEWLEKTYGEYWEIHGAEGWECMSIPELTQFTIPNGTRTFVALSSLENKDTITLGDLEQKLYGSG